MRSASDQCQQRMLKRAENLWGDQARRIEDLWAGREACWQIDFGGAEREPLHAHIRGSEERMEAMAAQRARFTDQHPCVPESSSTLAGHAAEIPARKTASCGLVAGCGSEPAVERPPYKEEPVTRSVWERHDRRVRAAPARDNTSEYGAPSAASLLADRAQADALVSMRRISLERELGSSGTGSILASLPARAKDVRPSLMQAGTTVTPHECLGAACNQPGERSRRHCNGNGHSSGSRPLPMEIDTAASSHGGHGIVHKSPDTNGHDMKYSNLLDERETLREKLQAALQHESDTAEFNSKLFEKLEDADDKLRHELMVETELRNAARSKVSTLRTRAEEIAEVCNSERAELEEVSAAFGGATSRSTQSASSRGIWYDSGPSTTWSEFTLVEDDYEEACQARASSEASLRKARARLHSMQSARLDRGSMDDLLEQESQLRNLVEDAADDAARARGHRAAVQRELQELQELPAARSQSERGNLTAHMARREHAAMAREDVFSAGLRVRMLTDLCREELHAAVDVRDEARQAARLTLALCRAAATTFAVGLASVGVSWVIKR